MKHTIEIPLKFSNPDCPEYWKNFIDDIKSRLYNDIYHYVPTLQLKMELANYGAEYYNDKEHDIGKITFKNEEAATFFILKWS